MTGNQCCGFARTEPRGKCSPMRSYQASGRRADHHFSISARQHQHRLKTSPRNMVCRSVAITARQQDLLARWLRQCSPSSRGRFSAARYNQPLKGLKANPCLVNCQHPPMDMAQHGIAATCNACGKAQPFALPIVQRGFAVWQSRWQRQSFPALIGSRVGLTAGAQYRGCQWPTTR